MTRPLKRSLTLHGHRTSISLEEPFWAEFRRIAAARGRGLNALAADIDDGRTGDTGLATAIRLFVLADLQARLGGAGVSAGAPADAGPDATSASDAPPAAAGAPPDRA